MSSSVFSAAWSSPTKGQAHDTGRGVLRIPGLQAGQVRLGRDRAGRGRHGSLPPSHNSRRLPGRQGRAGQLDCGNGRVRHGQVARNAGELPAPRLARRQVEGQGDAGQGQGPRRWLGGRRHGHRLPQGGRDVPPGPVDRPRHPTPELRRDPGGLRAVPGGLGARLRRHRGQDRGRRERDRRYRRPGAQVPQGRRDPVWHDQGR